MECTHCIPTVDEGSRKYSQAKILRGNDAQFAQLAWMRFERWAKAVFHMLMAQMIAL